MQSQSSASPAKNPARVRSPRRLVPLEAIAETLNFSVSTLRTYRRLGFFEVAEYAGRTPMYRLAEVREGIVRALFDGRRRPYFRRPRPGAETR